MHLHVHYRSMDTRRNIASILDLGTTDVEIVRIKSYFTLYFFQGTANPSDLLTKIHKYNVNLVSSMSLWQNGYEWMTLPILEMPVTHFMQMHIKLTIKFLVEVKDLNEHIYSPEEYISFDYNEIEKCAENSLFTLL